MGRRLYQNVRLRSANRGNACNTWYVNSSGNVNNNNASNANRFAPIVYSVYYIGLTYSVSLLKPINNEPKSLAECLNNTVVMYVTFIY